MRKLLGVVKGFIKFVSRSHRMWSSPLNACRFFVASNIRRRNWPSEFRYGNCVLRVRPTDWCAFEEIVLEGEYGVVEHILGGLPEPKVLDIGANVGLFSATVFGLSPKAFVCAVEASPANFACLDSNRQRNPNVDWHVMHYAIADNEGEIAFEDGAMSTGGRVCDEGAQRVPMTTLSWLIEQIGGDLDLVKMDIEGAEESALLADCSVLRRIRNLLVEIHPNCCSQQRVVECLQSQFEHLYAIPGRKSSKPLVLAARNQYTLPAFEG